MKGDTRPSKGRIAGMEARLSKASFNSVLFRLDLTEATARQPSVQANSLIPCSTGNLYRKHELFVIITSNCLDSFPSKSNKKPPRIMLQDEGRWLRRNSE